MTDPISSHGRRVQSDGALREALAKVDAKASGRAPAEDAAKARPLPGRDEVVLSNVAQRAMAEPEFDRVKVESIKQAIRDGQYPLDPRRIAESFAAIERMIGD